VVLKSHGGADVKAMSRAILKAGREVRRRVPEKIAASICAFHVEKAS
jgi:fatty acid/phospholipid biosynthesis enzyme